MGNKLQDSSRKIIRHFKYFYVQLGYRIWITLMLSGLVGILDGFGIAMFIPLLKFLGSKDEVANPENLGGFSFIIENFNTLGIPVTLVSILVLMIIFFVLKGTALFAQRFYGVVVQQYYISKLRIGIARNLCQFNYVNFSKSDIGRIQNTMSNEVGRVSTAFKSFILTIQSFSMLIVYILLAVLTNVQFAMLVVIGGALSNILYRSAYRKTTSLSRNITRENHTFQGLLIQMVSFFKYLKSTGVNHIYLEKVLRNIKSIENYNRNIGFLNSVLAALREPIIIVIICSVIIIQVEFFDSDLGSIILSLLLFYRGLNFLTVTQNSWNAFLNVSGSLENVKDFSNELELGAEENGERTLKNSVESVELDNVSFKYEERKVLNDISFSISENGVYGFIGESGSGKSTLLNIMSGLIKPSSGRVLVNGENIEELDKKSYQLKLGYITQEPILFSDSIFNNVTLWAEKNEENISKFWEVLDSALCREFVEKLPLKESCVLGNNGIQLSGGQKQRLCIARELFKDNQVLLMDEATSALDPHTEGLVLQTISNIKSFMKIIFISHKLKSLAVCDYIFLLRDGEIVERGTLEKMKKTASWQQTHS